MKDRVKEHDRVIRLARTQTSAVSEHAHNTGHYPLIDRHPHWYTLRVKEAIHIRLHPRNINRDSGIEFPDALDQETQQQECCEKADHWENKSTEQRKSGPLGEHLTGTAKIEMHQSQLLKTNQSQQRIVVYIMFRVTSGPHRSPDED